MTPGELKFALAVETVLNTIPQPEYRQLVVEALMVLTLVTEHNAVVSLGGLIAVEHLVHKANAIFLEDQVQNTVNIYKKKKTKKRELVRYYRILIDILFLDESRWGCYSMLCQTEGTT